ncbi:hypothetical protein ACWIWK_08045 [Helicobacter sp. 23-1048]
MGLFDKIFGASKDLAQDSKQNLAKDSPKDSAHDSRKDSLLRGWFMIRRKNDTA